MGPIRVSDWPDYLGLPRVRKADGSLKHIVCEGSRQHVVSWDSHGSHCSEKDCEINRGRKSQENSARRDIQLLERADRAVRQTTPRMRRATLEFLWDKYVGKLRERA